MIVVDAAGNPVKGAEIVTDGFYRIPTDVAASFPMSGTVTRELNDKTYAMDLTSEDGSSFAGPDGAVRNFTWKLTGEKPNDLGHYGSSVVYYLDSTDPQDPNAFLEDENVQLTLAPGGKLIDGSEGQTITRQRKRALDGPAVEDIPLGRYKITASYQGCPLCS